MQTGNDADVPTGVNSSNLCGELPQDTSLEPLLDIIRQQYGESILAVLVYGSWLRGQRDTMPDFYVLVDDYRELDTAWQGWLCRLLPPNVYHVCQPPVPAGPASALRGKVALLTLGRFCRAVRVDFHSYFWARFAQPCEVLYARDENVRTELASAFLAASETFVRKVIPAMGERFNSGDLWTRGFSMTYACELRTESTNRGASIYEVNRAHFDQAVKSFARENTSLSIIEPAGTYLNTARPLAKRMSSLVWATRRIQGKLLSVLRLLKAAFTFNEPLQYLLWKIERHSGLYIEPTTRQLKHPLIFAWPLLWKLRKRGAFR
ncbi:MAG: hypothetical protein OQJ84_08435 [Xanthomonadales bacterium]|nr:hypothetical protein [Xanthomonadales bacterium]